MPSDDSIVTKVNRNNNSNNDCTSIIKLLLSMLQFLILYEKQNKRIRKKTILRNRLCWSDFIRQYTDSKLLFHRTIRMEIKSFKLLVTLLDPILDNCKEMSIIKGSDIYFSTEVYLFCTLRYLSGGSYLDIIALTGMSKPYFYNIVWKTISAIIQCNHPLINNIKFPTTVDDCKDAAANFESISSNSAINNCVSVVDGYLLSIQTPSQKEVGNVRSYFSGHYQKYGINLQASCDHHCRFTFIGVAGPGVMADRDAIQEINLHNLIESLPIGYVVIGDAAYTPSEKLTPIYYGKNAKLKRYSDWNYYASQCRIRIEMSFGLLKNKWLILNSPLKVGMNNIGKLVIALGRLHNYCINQRLEESLEHAEQLSGSYTPTVPMQIDGTPLESNDNLQVLFSSNNCKSMSQTRENMVDRVEMLGLERPKHSVIKLQKSNNNDNN
jgi:DDE superfamily endonuclease